MPNAAQVLEQPTLNPSPEELTPAQAALLANDPLLNAYGIGKDLWADEHADEYVANLRAGWE